jgi:hypothetical protein
MHALQINYNAQSSKRLVYIDCVCGGLPALRRWGVAKDNGNHGYHYLWAWRGVRIKVVPLSFMCYVTTFV